MKHNLNAHEARVIGCLLKTSDNTGTISDVTQWTHSLVIKTSRDPVMELSESQVQQTLDFLLKNTLSAAKVVIG